MAVCFLFVLTTASAHAEVEEVEHYESLGAMTLGADAVVLGAVLTVEPGRVFSGCGYAAATLRVEELVAGTLPAASRARLTIEYFGFCDALPRQGVEIPREQALFFLRNKGEELRRVQPDATEMAVAAESMFWRTVILAGTVIDRGGSVHVPKRRTRRSSRARREPRSRSSSRPSVPSANLTSHRQRRWKPGRFRVQPSS